MDFKLLDRVLDAARDEAPPALAMRLRDIQKDLHDLDRTLSGRGICLDELEAHIAPDGLLDAVTQLYQACGDEGSEEADAVADLPSYLNEAIADVIRYGADL